MIFITEENPDWFPSKYKFAFDEGVEETKKHIAKKGTAYVSESFVAENLFPLGKWQSLIKERFRRRHLSDSELATLLAIGFNPEPLITRQFKEKVGEVELYKKKYGIVNFFKEHRFYDWQKDHMRYSSMQKEHEFLIKVGYDSSLSDKDVSLVVGKVESSIFQKNNYKPFTSPDYFTEDGFPLFRFQFDLLVAYMKYYRPEYAVYMDMVYRDEQVAQYSFDYLGEPTICKIVEELGLNIDNYILTFLQGFAETVIYGETHILANAPLDYKTTKGFELGKWQKNFILAHSRNSRKRKKVYVKTYADFSEAYWCISGKKLCWATDKDATFEFTDDFTEGAIKTNEFNEKYGMGNAPANYVTDAGFKLGEWQRNAHSELDSNQTRFGKILTLRQVGMSYMINEQDYLKDFYHELLKSMEKRELLDLPHYTLYGYANKFIELINQQNEVTDISIQDIVSKIKEQRNNDKMLEEKEILLARQRKLEEREAKEKNKREERKKHKLLLKRKRVSDFKQKNKSIVEKSPYKLIIKNPEKLKIDKNGKWKNIT